MKVKDCMCEEVCCVKPETKINEVAKLMEKNHIGCIPVCNDQNCIVGVITDRDITLRCTACDKDAKTTIASDIMTCNVCTCNENDNISDAERKMADKFAKQTIKVISKRGHSSAIVSVNGKILAE